ncbi:MAG: hypothetical protein ACE5E7_02735 [Anaerolineae bacterium]
MSDLTPAILAEMLREGLQSGRLPRLTVTSNSMAPLLRVGDQITLEPVSTVDLKPGDIITLALEEELLTHRFWGTAVINGREQLITSGDRPLVPDTPSAAAQLLGRVTARRCRRTLLLNQGIGAWLNCHLAWLSKVERRLWLGKDALTVMPATAAGPLPSSLPRKLVRWAILVWALLVTASVDAWVRFGRRAG